MDEVLTFILAFVAGDMHPAAFRDRLYEDDRFEPLLCNDPHLRPGNYVNGSAFHFLLALDFDDPGDVLNAQGALADFMDRNGITYSRTTRYQDFYDMVLEAQPRWLGVDAKWIRDNILCEAGNRQGQELVQWLRQELPKRFRSVAEPPCWIQSPEWPINENGPLIFLGELEVREYFHDVAAVYVFHDPVSGKCETVIQVN